MVLQQHYLGRLAHATYIVADEDSGVAAAVDPQRNIDRCPEATDRLRCSIAHVFLAHLPRDFISGHLVRDESSRAHGPSS